jgi:hypothetical protein
MTPTIKELIEKATPGPWQSHPFARTILSQVNAMTVADYAMPADGDLIARCNPEVMRTVIEALETNAAQGCDYSRDALALLNGVPPHDTQLLHP